MKNAALLFLVIGMFTDCTNNQDTSTSNQSYEYAIVIHGGAGYSTPERLGDEGEYIYKMALDSALSLGISVLEKGGSSLDAVEQVIRYMEDNPLFNAGRGAVLTNEGRAELDASIMNGADMNAGAVTGLTEVRHPISVARRVMDSSKHVFFSGSGASEFARLQGLEIVDQAYFLNKPSLDSIKAKFKGKKYGTVGCVALDKEGNLAAGTSTGGISNKKHGRVGDVPVIGAGTYAKNKVAGISCTGQGEFFIRLSVAKEVIALMEYKGLTVQQAAEEVIHTQVEGLGAGGGIICLDQNGTVAMVFNTSAMFRAYGNSAGEKVVAIFPDSK
ncbi:isoaspartyl peptidase/L-asparaginase family protein [Bacteroidota bacterium]